MDLKIKKYESIYETPLNCILKQQMKVRCLALFGVEVCNLGEKYPLEYFFISNSQTIT